MRWRNTSICKDFFIYIRRNIYRKIRNFDGRYKREERKTTIKQPLRGSSRRNRRKRVRWQTIIFRNRCMPVLSLVLFRLYRARGGCENSQHCAVSYGRLRPLAFMHESYRIVISGSEYGNLKQLILRTYYSLYLQSFYTSICRIYLGQGGEQSRIPTAN